MSDTDSFIEEVTEEVRRDRLFALFRKYGWIAITAVILIVAAAAFIEWRKAQDQAAAERLGDSILSAVSLPDGKARLGALAEASPSTPGGQAVLQLIEAAAMSEDKDPAGADAKLAAIASDPKTPQLYKDLASLKRLLIKDSPLSGTERSNIIDSLTTPGGPFRTLALEQRAITMIGSGDTAGALKIYSDLTQDAEATPALQQRARQMILVLGGKPDAA